MLCSFCYPEVKVWKGHIINAGLAEAVQNFALLVPARKIIGVVTFVTSSSSNRDPCQWYV
jgi:hypothetical protein